jgi:hypothetical protein
MTDDRDKELMVKQEKIKDLRELAKSNRSLAEKMSRWNVGSVELRARTAAKYRELADSCEQLAQELEDSSDDTIIR